MGVRSVYDVLVIAAGTRATVALEGALTFRGSADVEAFRSILTEVEAGLDEADCVRVAASGWLAAALVRACLC